MGNPYPADFLEPDGSVRLGGAITFTNPNNQPGSVPALAAVLAAGADANALAITNLADPTNNQDAATKAYVLAHAGGGSTAREILNGGLVSIANGASAALPWAKVNGSDLLDLSTATAPAVVTTGVYAVAVQVRPGDTLTAAGSYLALLELDASGEDAEVDMDSPPSTANAGAPTISLSLTYYLVAGATIVVTVRNHDGAASIHYRIASATIQRLT